MNMNKPLARVFSIFVLLILTATSFSTFAQAFGDDRFNPSELDGDLIAGADDVLDTEHLQDAKDKVESYYKAEMNKQGWEEKTAVAMGVQTMLIYQKQKRKANVIVSSDGEQTQVQLQIAAD